MALNVEGVVGGRVEGQESWADPALLNLSMANS